MTPTAVQLSAWKNWDAAAWGLALLRHYFRGHDARPVSRLAISPEELAKAAGAADTEAIEARDAFLRAVRCSAAAFRRILSTASLEGQAWDRHQPPPFLAYLFFTCFAAASLDADTADEGVFRERVRQLLGHHEGTSYALGDLSLLWEAFADWLRNRHDVGEPYRTLSLPDRGRMTLIGYSVRLAFPRREDRLRLRDLLAASGTGPTPTVPEAFLAIAGTRDRFSTDFRHVFDRARAALASGRDAPELQALWSAILEAAALDSRPGSRNARVRYQLLAQENELGRIDPFVVTAGVPPGASHGARFSRLDEPFGEFDHFVCAADGSTGLIAKLLLMDALEDKAPRFGASPIPRAVKEGVLLFRQADSATWELAVTRPREGRVRALVRTRLAGAFLSLMNDQRQSRETQFDGWREVDPFDVTDLAEPRARTAPELASIRCLQRIEIGPQLHLVGGIRIDGGYLGLSGLLPEVNCPEAAHVALFRVSDASGELRSTHVATLEPVSERPGVFGWAPGQGDLEGAYVLAATKGGRVVVPREILFHARGLRYDFEGPTDPTRWLVEVCTSDVAPAGEASDTFLTPEIGSPAPLLVGDTLLGAGIQILENASVDDDTGYDRLVETLAAISVARKGIAEAELVDILGKTLRHATGFAVWGIIRGWLEAGYLDCLTKRQWRGRVYFARRPRLVLIPDDSGSIRGVLHGLAPYRLRSATREAFSRAGARSLPASSLSRYVPAPQAWRFESLEHANAGVEEFGEIATASVREPRDLVGDFDDVVSDEAPLPPGYECQRIWDWSAGGFRRPNASASADADEVRIEYHTRTNGPDRYVVEVSGQRRTTLSRSWALLDGFRRAGRHAFASVGALAIVRSGDDGPQVPLPIARAIGLRAGIVGGPRETAVLGRHYAYATDCAGVRRWLIAWMSGIRLDEAVTRRFAWLRAATAARGQDNVPLPADIRRRLRSLHALPDALSIAERRIPRHLIAHVRRAVELAET